MSMVQNYLKGKMYFNLNRKIFIAGSIWKKDIEIYTEDWIGVLRNPPFTPDWFFGFNSLGPVLPKQPPRILEHITKNLFVSIGKFGPIA